VLSGKLSEKLIHTSKIYDGMKSEYWVYVPAGYDPQVPAAADVFQDGSGYINRDGNNPALNVIDNLIAQKKIPVMICVFINPGDVADAPGTPPTGLSRPMPSSGTERSKTPCAARNMTPSVTATTGSCG